MELTPKIAREITEYMLITNDLISGSEKEASATFDDNKLAKTVGSIAAAGFIKEAEQEEAISTIKNRPEVLLDFIDKIAAMKQEENKGVKPLGQGVAKQASTTDSVSESDKVFDALVSRLQYKL